MATKLVGVSASTAPARAARTPTATMPTQPSASESRDRAPTQSWEEVGRRAPAAFVVLLPSRWRNIEAKTITNTLLGVPYHSYSIVHPNARSNS